MAKPEDKTILVVDDEPDIVLFLSTALEEARFKVQTALDGNQALDKVRESAPDFISLDLVMPGKSGIRFFHELRRHKGWSKIPVMVVTGHAREHASDLAEITDARTVTGPALYLEKPIRAQDFVRAVAQAVGVTLEEEAGGDAVEELRREAGGDAVEELRREARSLLDAADPQALAEALALLRGKKGV